MSAPVERIHVVAEFCDSEFIYRGWHLYANDEWVRGIFRHTVMAACGFDPCYELDTPDFLAKWRDFVKWFAETYPNGADFKALPFHELELIGANAVAAP